MNIFFKEKEDGTAGIGTENNPKILADSIEKINNKIEELNWMVYAVMIVVFLGFIGMLLSYFSILSDNWRHKEDAYYQLDAHYQVLEKVNQNNCEFIKIK